MSDDRTRRGFPPPPKPPTAERRDSIGALDDNDRALLNNVLNTAKAALEQSKTDAKTAQEAIARESAERTALEGKMMLRFSDYDTELQDLKTATSEYRGLAGDVRGLRGDISGLTSAVTANLADDARRERNHAELKLQVEMMANESGRAAGKAAGGRWGVVGGLTGPILLGFVIWLFSAIVALVRGQDLPPIPTLQPTPSAVPSAPPVASGGR